MKLTEEEKQIILEKRRKKEVEKREKEEVEKSKKIAYLKEDLYFCQNDFDVDFYDTFITKIVRDEIIQKITEQFKLAVPKGTEFVCFIEKNGEESWYDNAGYGIEYCSSDWAKKHLINIKKMK